jgi:hypothetical protein
MNNDLPNWKIILRINLKFIGATLSLSYGWVCWQIASKEWWGFALMAGLAAIGGGITLVGALYELNGVLRKSGRVRDLKEKGAEARADRAPDHHDLKNHGMKR